jgi:hypothetical protein
MLENIINNSELHCVSLWEVREAGCLSGEVMVMALPIYWVMDFLGAAFFTMFTTLKDQPVSTIVKQVDQ